MLKEIAYKASKDLAALFLRWSNHWGDVAESIATGRRISEIRDERIWRDQ